jgi:alanine racemase
MLHSSYLEIKRTALQNNINFLKLQIGPSVVLSSVIKGNAYGHGIDVFAPLAQSCGIEHFSVFSADEAFRLQDVLPRPASTMIMGYIDNPELEWAIENNIEFYVFDLERLEAAIDVAKKLRTPAFIHLELETGMNRTGLDTSSIKKAKQLITVNREHSVLKGLCTHYAGAESKENHERIVDQQIRFNRQIESFTADGIKAELLHSACSAAMMAYPSSHRDMVRVGIMQYGFWPSPETKSMYLDTQQQKTDSLQRLITWKSKIMSIKTVPKGDYVGYGNSFKAHYDMILAIVPVGYAWGYNRSLSNIGQVLIHEELCPVVGTINMNIMMVDITHLMDAKISDEVVLLGTQGKQSISVASFGELSTQLNYELLTRLPINIPRLVVD